MVEMVEIMAVAVAVVLTEVQDMGVTDILELITINLINCFVT